MQNYTNYRIVFIDDCSDDETFRESKRYLLDELRFEKGRVDFVRNLEHKFATYNILHAGFEYCGEGDIQVIVDGDDMLIGKQVFQIINAEFQKKDLWVMYTFYINDKYQ